MMSELLMQLSHLYQFWICTVDSTAVHDEV